MAIVACVTLLLPAAGMAATACTQTAAQICTAPSATADCDGDGISDLLECQGFSMIGTSKKAVTGWRNSAGASDFLDPSKPDLFYMTTGIGPTYLDISPTGRMAKAIAGTKGLQLYADGLGITTHLVTKNDVAFDEKVPLNFRGVLKNTAGTAVIVKAALIIEDTCDKTDNTCNGTSLGVTQWSVPTLPGVSSKIYTEKIYKSVDTYCKTGTSCSILGNPSITNANGIDAIVSYYILQVMGHEMSHGSKLGANNKELLNPQVKPTATNPNLRYPTSTANATNYYHYTESSLLMAPTASFSNGIWTIPTAWLPGVDKIAVTLK